MSPTLGSGDIVITAPLRLKRGSIVLAKVNGRDIIKRIGMLETHTVYLVGDNTHDSTDSRHFGPVSKSAILGTIMIVLPKATNPPKIVKPYGLMLGRVAAFVLVVMALVHLFRIDTLVPILDDLLPGGSIMASIFTTSIIFTEIFAIPFALRMKLSPLAHIISGAFVALAPLWWLLLAIWAYGTVQQVGQLGQFVTLYSTGLLVGANLLWVAFNYYGLYTLGYNRLSVRSLLRK